MSRRIASRAARQSGQRLTFRAGGLISATYRTLKVRDCRRSEFQLRPTAATLKDFSKDRKASAFLLICYSKVMMTSWLIFGLLFFVAAYFLFVFVVLRITVPFMGFGELMMPSRLPSEIKEEIAKLEIEASSPMEYLKLAYKFVTSRWRAGRMDTLYYAPLAFRKDISEILRGSGYAHCNTQNYLLYVLLAGSRYFDPKDIKTRSVFFNFFIHQYLQVRIGERWIDADPAGTSIRGMSLGTHISFFG